MLMELQGVALVEIVDTAPEEAKASNIISNLRVIRDVIFLPPE